MGISPAISAFRQELHHHAPCNCIVKVLHSDCRCKMWHCVTHVAYAFQIAPVEKRALTSHHVIMTYSFFWIWCYSSCVFLLPGCCWDYCDAPDSTEQCSRRSFWDSGSLDNFGLRTYQKIMRGINKASEYVSRITMGETWWSVMSIGSVTVSFQKWADSISRWHFLQSARVLQRTCWKTQRHLNGHSVSIDLAKL